MLSTPRFLTLVALSCSACASDSSLHPDGSAQESGDLLDASSVSGDALPDSSEDSAAESARECTEFASTDPQIALSPSTCPMLSAVQDCDGHDLTDQEALDRTLANIVNRCGVTENEWRLNVRFEHGCASAAHVTRQVPQAVEDCLRHALEMRRFACAWNRVCGQVELSTLATL